jgi:hypothetical protein
MGLKPKLPCRVCETPTDQQCEKCRKYTCAVHTTEMVITQMYFGRRTVQVCDSCRGWPMPAALQHMPHIEGLDGLKL